MYIFLLQTEYLSLDYYAALIYDNYVFTVPMFLDICMFYGRENRARVHKIISDVVSIQPKYMEDLKKSVPFVIKVRYKHSHIIMIVRLLMRKYNCSVIILVVLKTL